MTYGIFWLYLYTECFSYQRSAGGSALGDRVCQVLQALKNEPEVLLERVFHVDAGCFCGGL